jgi:predicted secreted protein
LDPQRSVGTKIKIGTNYIAGLTSIGGIDKSADTLDTTTLDSNGGYRTFTGGFKDGGEVSLSGYFGPGDAGQLALDAAYESGNAEAFEIIFPSALGASWVFSGVVTAFSTGAELEDLVSFEATVKVSGKPSLSTTASAGLSGLSLTGLGGTLSPTFANTNYSYSYGGVSASSVTITATAAAHTLKLYIDDEYSQDLTSGSASASIPLTLNVGKKLTVIAWEDSKTPVIYEVVAIKTT